VSEGRRPDEPGRERRPLLERIGMAAIALVMAGLFGLVAAAAWVGGELFLATMGAIGCFMTLWVGAITLIRG
jgi:fatty acid desaturase